MINVELKEDRVLIEPLEPEKATASGIILPDSETDAPLVGTVVAVGPDESVKSVVGDIVYYSSYGHETFKPDGKEYILTREEHIIGKRK